MAGGVKDEWTAEGKQFMKELRELADLQVRIGYQAGEEDNGVELVDIAMWNEMGTEHSPSRPFMRDSVDKHEADINKMLKSQKEALLNGTSAEKILKTVGLFQKDLIQTEIEQGEFVANAQATIRRKGSDKPLIDTGRMKNSVNYEIVKKGSVPD